MKILIATMPFPGHVNPLTGVAAGLAAHGHEVRWYAAPSYVQRLEALGVVAVPFVRAREITGANVAEIFPERARVKGPRLISFDFAHIFTANIAANVADITDLHRAFPFERLVCDDAFYAASILGPTLGVPVHAVSPGPSLIPAPDVPPPFFGLRPARHALDRAVHSVVRRMVHSSMGEGLVEFNTARRDAGLAPLPTSEILACVDAVAARVYQVGIPETDFPRTAPPAVEYVGDLPPWRGTLAPTHLDERITDWPGRVVVVSQGTVDNRDADKLLAPTIEAVSGDPATLVVAVTAGAGTRELRARYPGANVIVEDHLDFDVLLPHADVLVSNGGHGSVLAALSHAVPLVVAGTREGKNDINVRLAWNRLARDLRTETPTPRAIRRAVDQVATDEALRSRVAHVAGLLAGYDSVALVERGITAPSAEEPVRPASTRADR